MKCNFLNCFYLSYVCFCNDFVKIISKKHSANMICNCDCQFFLICLLHKKNIRTRILICGLIFPSDITNLMKGFYARRDGNTMTKIEKFYFSNSKWFCCYCKTNSVTCVFNLKNQLHGPFFLGVHGTHLIDPGSMKS